nr:isoform 2 of sterol 3-beta-glucosyltransferase ugt80a2 [Quercus suber]
MAVQASAVQRPNDSESVVQQVILQQAQAAAAAAQTGPTRPEAPLQNTDLVSLDVIEDGTAPPAYGDVYGEIHNEKEGLGTSASVANDGRVNIRINHINRHLSQLITPALRQEDQNAQRDHPHSLSPFPSQRQDGASPPPPLNIVIQVVGSRGDVQPFIALGKVLKNTYGHRVRLATHSNFKNFVEENGLEFFNIGGDPSRLMAFMAKNPSLMPGFRSLFSGDISQQRKEVSEYIQGCWRSCYEAGDGIVRATDVDLLELSSSDPSSESAARPFVADCIIANPPSFAHIHCAEKLGIPLHIMFTMPYAPTQAFPHPLANIQSSNADPQLTNFMSYAMIELLSWQGIGDIMNRFRKKCLGLDPVSLIWAPGMLHRLKLDSADYVPAADLQAFLDAGPPPVYIGFGSIVLDDPNAMTELIFDSVRKSGQRVLLSKG